MTIPLLGGLIFFLNISYEKYKIIDQMENLNAVTEISIKVGDLIHEIQKERGRSAGYLGSNGGVFSKELSQQILVTDSKLKQLKEYVNTTEFSLVFDSTYKFLSKLESKRNQINLLQLSASEAIDYYTKLNNILLEIIVQLNKKEDIYTLVSAYTHLLNAKENAGIERAILSNTFALGRFKSGMYPKFTSLIKAQDIYINSFLSIAPSIEKDYYYKTHNGPYVDEVERMRKTAFNKEVREELINKLVANAGYGGLIHQFKNYVIRGEDAFYTKKYIDAFNDHYKEIAEVFEKYKNLSDVSLSDLQNIEIIEHTFKQYKQNLSKAINLKKENKSLMEVDIAVKVDDRQAIEALNELIFGGNFGIEPSFWWDNITGKINILKEVENHLTTNLKKESAEIKQKAQNTFSFFLIFSILLFAITTFLSYSLIRNMLGTLRKMVIAAEEIGQGNLETQIHITTKDELGKLGGTMNNMITGLKETKEKLTKEKDYTSNIITSMTDMLLVLDQKGNIVTANKVTLENLGYSEEELINKPISTILAEEEFFSQDTGIENLIKNDTTSSIEKTYLTKKGHKISVLFSGSVLINNEEKIEGVVCVAHDITERKKSEDLIKESEQEYQSLYEEYKTQNEDLVEINQKLEDHTKEIAHLASMPEQYPNIIIEFDRNGKTIYLNPVAEKQIPDLIKKGLNHPLFERAPIDNIRKSKSKNKTFEYEVRLKNNYFILKIHKLDNEEGIRVFAFDYTNQKHMEENLKTQTKEIKRSLIEKEILLKEVHHRVKNNLQVIISLLSLQSNLIEDVETQKLFDQNKSRIKAMSVVHEMLYQSDNFSEINYRQYIMELGMYLVSSIAGDTDRIKLKIEANKIYLDINKAIPMGLLINEIITNSLKHGFSNEERGSITISLKKKKDGLVLEIGDDGVGMGDFDKNKPIKSLGLKLISSLTKQLHGTFKMNTTRKGTHYVFHFEKRK